MMVPDKLVKVFARSVRCLSVEFILPLHMPESTYVKQLQNCDKSVMQKRLDEMAHSAIAESQPTEQDIWHLDHFFIACLQEMTYVKQLEDYEEAVMQKRLDEMPQAERERILTEIEQQKQGNGQQGKQ